MYSLAFLSCSLLGRLVPVDYNPGVPLPFQLGLAEENHWQRFSSWFPRGLSPGASAQAPNLTGLLSTLIPDLAPSVLLLKRLPTLAALLVSHCPCFLLTLHVTLCEVSSLAPLYLNHQDEFSSCWAPDLYLVASVHPKPAQEVVRCSGASSQTRCHLRSWKSFIFGL